MRADIVLLPGDGIGPEVIEAGCRVLDVLAESDKSLAFDFTRFDWGSDYYRRTGLMMPKDGLAQLGGFDAIYFGAVGDPHLPDDLTLWGLRLAICQGFDQFANVRPSKLLPGVVGPLRPDLGQAIDWVIVTLVAGIIAAAPSPNDKFIGVAPGAEIVSIRQTSAAFAEENPPQGRTEADRSAANMMSLAKSIVHAANLGATVINLSVTACVDAGSPADLRALAGALQYAAVEKNAVIISAAGNVGNSCQTNPGYDPANPSDPRNWDGVKSVSLPSYFSNLVLSVGGSDLTGAPYVNTMPGPWVGVAAPAMNISKMRRLVTPQWPAVMCWMSTMNMAPSISVVTTKNPKR